MIVQFKASGTVTLGDDLAQIDAGERWTVQLEQFGLSSRVQEEDLPEPNGGVPFLNPLGNLKGPLVFTATRSFDTFAAGASDFGTKLGLVDTQDTLVLLPYGNTAGQTKFSFANSICESVHRVPPSNGVKWVIRYQFRIGALTITTV